MAETLSDHGVWRWADMAEDLRQAGLQGVIIDPLSLGENCHSIGGSTKEGEKFYVTWLKDHFMMLSMKKKNQSIINAFSKVLEYKPFAEYISAESGIYTIEWDKKDAKGRFKALQEKKEKNLKEIAS